MSQIVWMISTRSEENDFHRLGGGLHEVGHGSLEYSPHNGPIGIASDSPIGQFFGVISVQVVFAALVAAPVARGALPCCQ